MALNVTQINDKVRNLRAQAGSRDQRMQEILSIRQGDSQAVFPDLFPAAWPKPVVANFVDVVARDLAEVIAPLPAFNCSAGNMLTTKAREFADKKTKIAHHYSRSSRLQLQMFTACDRYLSYGFVPFTVEPDFDNCSPRIRIEDPIGTYPEVDRWGNTVSFTRRVVKSALDLAAEWPEYADMILGRDRDRAASTMLEVIRYSDADQTVMYLPERQNLVLARMDNPIGLCPVVVAFRPGLDNDARGQFDDVLWVQIARARMAMLALEATEKAVQAPLALPQDVQEMSFGGDAILRSATPEKIRRVGLELPPAAFEESQLLAQEMRTGSRYPEGREGVVGGSVVTGRGIQELMGGFDTQIKTAQSVLQETFRSVFKLCFLMDECLWGNMKKTIRGTAQGSPFEISYTPSVDIAGDHTIDVTYGFAAGMDPNRALVFLLQLRGDKLIDRDTVQRQLPFDVDVSSLRQKLDMEETNDALKQGVFAYAQSLGMMVQQGQDGSQILHNVASIIDHVRKGDEFYVAVQKAFTPPAPPPGAAPGSEGAPGTPGSAPAPGGLAGLLAGAGAGMPPGTAPGQAGQGPGGAPSLQTLLAGLSGGKPVLNANVSQRIPVAS